MVASLLHCYFLGSNKKKKDICKKFVYKHNCMTLLGITRMLGYMLKARLACLLFVLQCVFFMKIKQKLKSFLLVFLQKNEIKLKNAVLHFKLFFSTHGFVFHLMMERLKQIFKSCAQLMIRWWIVGRLEEQIVGQLLEAGSVPLLYPRVSSLVGADELGKVEKGKIFNQTCSMPPPGLQVLYAHLTVFIF